MPERHAYRIQLTQQSSRCQKMGCPEVAVYEGIYRFQHEGDKRATQRSWFYCQRHGEGFAMTHALVCPEAPEGLAKPPRPEETIDVDGATGFGTFRRRWRLT